MTQKHAPLVIDAQEFFRRRNHFRDREFLPCLQKQQALIDIAMAAGLPIVQIFIDDDSALSPVFEICKGNNTVLDHAWRGVSQAPLQRSRWQLPTCLVGRE